MPITKNTKTLYSKTNPVDIASLLTNSNINSNVNLFQNQIGGKKTTNEPIKHTNKKYDDDDDLDDNDTDSDNDSEVDSQFGKGKKEDNNEEEHAEENEEEENEEEENEEENEGVENDINKAANDVDENEENDDEIENRDDDEAKTVVSENEDDDKETLDTNNKCYSKYAKDKDDDFDLGEYFKDDDIVITKTGRVGKPILFKYEKVRLLSDRSRQLAEGAKPMIKNTMGLSHKEIALLELKNKLIPLIIERPIPNAGSERWKLSELEIPDYD